MKLEINCFEFRISNFVFYVLPLLILWPLAGSSTNTPPAKPAIVSPTPLIKAVEFSPNVLQSFDFELQNTGDAALVISNVRACCGASVELDEKIIPPGTGTVVKFNLQIRGRGRVNKSFYIHSNDPVNPIYQLRVTGQFRDPADILIDENPEQ